MKTSRAVVYVLFLLSISLQNIFSEAPSSSNVASQPNASGVNPGGIAPAGSADNFLFTGSFLYSVPLSVPPGINGMEPQLVLNYNSSQGNGWVGTGWELSLGSIQRSTKNGVPSYTGADTFILSMQGQTAELTQIPDGTYRSKNEGAFAKFVKQGNEWVMTDKMGTRYFFGSSVNSQITFPNAGIYLWALNKVIDRNGNYMLITYNKPQGEAQIYPESILYTGNENTGREPVNQISFVTTPGTVRELSYSPKFAHQISSRLSYIQSHVNGVKSWKYEFSYITSQQTSRNLLKEVQKVGLDGVTKVSLFSATHNLENIPFNLQNYRFVDNLDGEAETVQIIPADFNGDGKQDYIQIAKDNSRPQNNQAKTRFFFSKGNGTFEQFGPNPDLALTLVQNQITLGDFNGDGKTDLLRFDYRGSQNDLLNPITIFTSNANGSFTQRNFSLSSPLYQQNLSRVLVADFNGDAVSDIFIYNAQSSMGQVFLMKANLETIDMGARSFPYLQVSVIGDFNGDGKQDIGCYKTGQGGSKLFFSNGDGTFQDAGQLPGNSWGFHDMRMSAIDLNKDNISDIVLWDNGHDHNGSPSSNSPKVVVYLSKGDGFFYKTSYITTGGVKSPEYTSFMESGDFNGDGLNDLILATPSNNPSSAYAKIFLNKGEGVLEYWADAPWNDFRTEQNSIVVGDFNGDTQADLMTYRWRNASYGGRLYFSNEDFPDLISQINNAIGGGVKTKYISSSKFLNTFLPFSIPVVSEIAQFDGRSNNPSDWIKNSFSYEGGFFDTTFREFLGFKKVYSTDQKGTKTVSTFLQNLNHLDRLVEANAMKGRLYKKEIYDSFGQLLRISETVWEMIKPFTNVYFVRTGYTRSRNVEVNPPIVAQVDFAYDDVPYGPGFGNLIQTYNSGDISITGDEIKENIEYGQNPTKYIVGLPIKKIIRGPRQEILGETQYFYDGSQTLGTITKGNLTQVKKYLETPSSQKWITSKTEFNSEGFVTAVIDPKGNRTETEYDAKGFPVLIRNPHGFTVKSQYDPLTGQVLSDTDLNNQTSIYKYDSMGRLVKAIGPLDSEAFPTAEYDYRQDLWGNTAQQHIFLKKRERHGTSDSLWSKEYFDGLGRTYKTEIEGKEDSIISETRFNNRGLVDSQSIPRYSADTHLRWTNNIYDALGRLKQTIYPDGTSEQITYLGYETRFRDADGVTQTAISDSAGRTIKRYEPGVSAPTQFTYDPLGRLTLLQDSQGKLTYFTYDSLGNKLSMKDPNSGTWVYTYDDNRNMTSQLDPRGIKIGMTYDGMNRLLEKSIQSNPQNINNQPVGTKLAVYNYDHVEPARPYSKGRLTTVRDPNGVVHFYHDSLGRLTRQTKELGTVTYEIKNNYDALDRVKEIIYPNDYSVKYEYDNGGNLTRVTNQDASTVFVSYPNYSAVGKVLNQEQTNGKIKTSYSYESFKQRLKELKTESWATGTPQRIKHHHYNYYNGGNIYQITDQINSANYQAFLYDPLQRLKEATGSYGIQTFSYDSLGNFLTKGNSKYIYSDPRHPYAVTKIQKQIISDKDNSTLLAMNLSSSENIYKLTGQIKGSAVSLSQPVTMVLKGEIEQAVTLSSTTTSFEFRGVAGGQSISVSPLMNNRSATPSNYSFPSFSKNEPLLDFNLTTSSAINANTAKSFSHGQTGPVFVQGRYDEALSFNGVSDIFAIPNTSNINPAQLTIMVQIKPTSYPTQQYATLISKSSSSYIGNLTNGYRLFLSRQGKISFEIGKQAGTSIIASSTKVIPLHKWSFVAVTFDGTKLRIYIDGVYDSVANYTLPLITNTFPVTLGASLNDKKQIAAQTFFQGVLDEPRIHSRAWSLAEIQKIQSELIDTYDFSYDEAGNMVSKVSNEASWNYQFDVEGRLAKVSNNGTQMALFLYDGDGGRVQKTTAQGTTKYIGKLFEIRPDGSYVNHIFGAGQLVASRIQPISGVSSIQYFQTDHLGSISSVTNENGTVIHELAYAPFGEKIKNIGTSSLKHTYTSQEEDPEIDLQYYNARYYDPALGRFISPDAIVPDVFNPQTLNRYSYVTNNPVILTDPDGEWVYAAIIIGAILGGIQGGIQSEKNGKPWYQGAAQGAVIGAVIGGLSAGYGTGISEAVGGGVPGLIIGNSVAGAFSGAAYSGAYGGDMWTGFYSGFVGSFTASLLNLRPGIPIISNSIGGGVAAEAAGGKFSEGLKQSAVQVVATSMLNTMIENDPTFTKESAKNIPNNSAVYLESTGLLRLLFYAAGDDFSHVIIKDKNGAWHDTHLKGKSGVVAIDDTSKNDGSYFQKTLNGRRYNTISAKFDTNKINQYAEIKYLHHGLQVCTVYASRASNGQLLGLSPGTQMYNNIGYRPSYQVFYKPK
ncbi:MAG: FG-GAP-like repeat-containing protein [Elusimicrobiota bacterium]